MGFKCQASLALATVLFLSGCAQMASHDKLASQVQTAQATGGPAAALRELEASATSDDARAALLYNLERGELLRQDKKYKESTVAWQLADQKVREWEETAKTDPSKLMGLVGASIISERLKPYEGQDYEKVFLTTRMALNRMAELDWDNARVDIKRTHEREAVIAEFRAKELAEAESEAKSKGVNATGKTLDGYPVETLNDPEVLKLRNGYQNALSHYLAGFLYEILNEPGLAAPGYRKAIELRPDTPLLEEGLRGLDTRTGFTHRRRQQMTDVLFIVESGSAPARKPKAFTVPIPVAGRLNSISISYPVIEPSNDRAPGELTLGSVKLKPETVVDVNVMARRALKDEMNGMILRGTVRAVVKGFAQDELAKRAGPLGGLLGTLVAAATEQADDRIWRTLPGMVSVARGYLPEGEHRLTLDGRDTGVVVPVSGQYALVSIQIRGGMVSLSQPASFGRIVAAAEPRPSAPAPAPEVVAVPADAAKPVAAKANRKPAAAPAAKSPSKSDAKGGANKTKPEPAR